MSVTSFLCGFFFLLQGLVMYIMLYRRVQISNISTFAEEHSELNGTAMEDEQLELL